MKFYPSESGSQQMAIEYQQPQNPLPIPNQANVGQAAPAQPTTNG